MGYTRTYDSDSSNQQRSKTAKSKQYFKELYTELNTRADALPESTLKQFLKKCIRRLFASKTKGMGFLVALRHLQSSDQKPADQQVRALIHEIYMMAVDRALSERVRPAALDEFLEEYKQELELENPLVRLARMIHQQRFQHLVESSNNEDQS